MGAQELKHQVKLEQWKEQIATCRSSGMSVRRWCIQNHVNQKTYYRWEKEVNMSAAFYTRRRQCFTVAAEKFDTCGGGI